MECHKKGTKDIVDRLKGVKKYMNAMMSGRALFLHVHFPSNAWELGPPFCKEQLATV